ALFGAPRAHEDHARRALLSAMGIRRVLGGDPAGPERRLDLPVRIGVHSGPVVFAPVADSFRMDTAIGNTAVIAARLRQAAEPGSILLSEATRQLALGFARVDTVGPLALKGIPEPISAYHLLDVSHRRAVPEVAASPRVTSFVGRGADLAGLRDCYRQAQN